MPEHQGMEALWILFRSSDDFSAPWRSKTLSVNGTTYPMSLLGGMEVPGVHTAHERAHSNYNEYNSRKMLPEYSRVNAQFKRSTKQLTIEATGFLLKHLDDNRKFTKAQNAIRQKANRTTLVPLPSTETPPARRASTDISGSPGPSGVFETTVSISPQNGPRETESGVGGGGATPATPSLTPGHSLVRNHSVSSPAPDALAL